MDLIEVGFEAKFPDHFVDLSSQSENHGAERHHAVPAVPVNGSVGLDQAPETRDLQSPIPQDPIRHPTLTLRHLLRVAIKLTLFAGKSSCSDREIFWSSRGYLVSHAMRNRTALPLGFERFPSPNASPTTYAWS